MSITPMPWATATPTARAKGRGEWRSPVNPTTPTGTALQRARAAAKNARATDSQIQDRNDLILKYLPLVKFIASRIAGRLPSHVEVDDLVESGIIGLIDALEKFDPSQQIKFKTYAEFRIRGSILDELRALDWVPRSTRQKSARLEKAYGELEQRLGRSASDAEMMSHLGVGSEEFDHLVQEARGAALISLDELRSDGEEGFERSLIEYLTDPAECTPAQNLNFDELYRIVADTIDQLPEKERLIISLYYYEELTMKEIGEILNVTESRISQVHTKAVLRLRGRMMKALER